MKTGSGIGLRSRSASGLRSELVRGRVSYVILRKKITDAPEPRLLRLGQVLFNFE